jgi:AmpD protein
MTRDRAFQAERVTAPAVSLWRNGWYAFARQMMSPNFGARPVNTAVDLIVIHSISLPPGKFGGNEVQQLFTNCLDQTSHPYFSGLAGLQVSSHFYIRRNGELWQFVSVDDRAWHAGKSSFLGRHECNDYSVGIELEGIEGGLFEALQYETLSALCSSLKLVYPIHYLAGHEHVAPGRKSDPGSGFNWRQFQQSLSWPPEYFPK